MRLIDYYFYLCSKYMGIGNSEPSLLSGAGGIGIWLGVSVLALMGTIPSTEMRVLLVGNDGKTLTIPSICIMLFSIIISFYYFKRNDKWKKIVEHYGQKQIKCEFLVYMVYTVFMYLLCLGAIPFVIKQIIKLCS